MSKHMTDEELDKQLESYFSALPKINFELNTEIRNDEKINNDIAEEGGKSPFARHIDVEMISMKNGIIRGASAAASLMVVAGGLLAANTLISQIAPGAEVDTIDSVDSAEYVVAAADMEKDSTELNVSVKPYADNESADPSEGCVYIDEANDFYIGDENKTQLTGDALTEYAASGFPSEWYGYSVDMVPRWVYHVDTLRINVSGSDLLTYDVECRRGELYKCIYNGDNPNVNPSTVNITPNDDIVVVWKPSSKFFDEYIGYDDVEHNWEELTSIYDRQKEALSTAEGFTKYFGDTITITGHYDNGESMCTTINITLDENGRYILKYDHDSNTDLTE